jgi:hypothetical protein
MTSITRKKKECIQCLKEKFIFSHGRCKPCANMVAQSLKKAKRVEKKQTVAELKKELDAIFSQFIRLRGSTDGYNSCYTCGKVLPITKLQCGHYESRRHLSLRWNEINCNPQCIACNVLMHGNYPKYSLKLCEEHGINILTQFDEVKNIPTKYGKFELKTLITSYKEKVNQLKEKVK